MWVFIFHDEEGAWPRYVVGDEAKARACFKQASSGWVTYLDPTQNCIVRHPVKGRFHLAKVVENGQVVPSGV